MNDGLGLIAKAGMLKVRYPNSMALNEVNAFGARPNRQLVR
jgi:hypothetical protein